MHGGGGGWWRLKMKIYSISDGAREVGLEYYFPLLHFPNFFYYFFPFKIKTTEGM